MDEKPKKKRKIFKWIRYSLLASVLIIIGVYFIAPTLITDFFHLGIDRSEITLREKQERQRLALLQKWESLEEAKTREGKYPPFKFTSEEIRIFVQEMYRKALTEEVKGIDLQLIDDEVVLKIKLNLAGYEEEIKATGTPQIAEMLKEDIVFTVRASIEEVVDGMVAVDVKSLHFGFVPLPLKLIENIVNSKENVRKYGRVFDWRRYPLPRGIENLKIKDSILYVNY